MPATQRYVTFVAADFDLRTLAFGGAIGLDTYHHDGLAAAVTDGLDVDEIVGPAEKLRAARKQLAAEVLGQAVTQHRDVELVDHRAELANLHPGQELRFV